MTRRKPLFSGRFTTKNQRSGVRLRNGSGAVTEGWCSLSVTLHAPAEGELYFYGSNDRGGRSYRTAHSSAPGMRIKAVERTRTLHLGAWVVTFLRASDFERAHAALQRTGFVRQLSAQQRKPVE